jgi:hypothetical protein
MNDECESANMVYKINENKNNMATKSFAVV